MKFNCPAQNHTKLFHRAGFDKTVVGAVQHGGAHKFAVRSRKENDHRRNSADSKYSLKCKKKRTEFWMVSAGQAHDNDSRISQLIRLFSFSFYKGKFPAQ